MRKLFPLFLIIALVVPSSSPGLPILSRGAVALASGGAFSPAPRLLGSSAPWHPSPSAPPPPSGLYRTRLAVRQSYDWTRLERVGVTVLERGDDWALVLADEEQLEALARLRFQPQSTDELGVLVTAHAQAKPWLATSLRPLLDQAAAVRAEVQGSQGAEERASIELEAAWAALRVTMRSLTPEQVAGISTLSSVDDDADGLTNTQEAWWCTDPLNPDSDGDGATDGEEVQAAKDWLANAAASYPSTGKPFSLWPPQIPGCVDDDQDSVPDMAERWELGLNMNRESTDRDKFDDGQELFGNTYCPGSGGFCGYGALPRNEDWGVIFAEMPSWVEAPGNHPLAAAFPVPEIDVVESSLHMEAVTTVTTDHIIGEGTELSESTSTTEGTSTSTTETETWNGWQEVSTYEYDSSVAFSSSGVETSVDLVSEITALTALVGMLADIKDIAKSEKGIWEQLGFAIRPGEDNCLILEEDVEPQLDNIQVDFELNQWCSPDSPDWSACMSGTGMRMSGQSDALYKSWEFNALRGDGISQEKLSIGADGNLLVEGKDPSKRESKLCFGQTQVVNLQTQSTPFARISDVRTEGTSHGGEFSTSHTAYEEQTVTNGEAWSESESWGTATALDSSHAADLWFTYQVRNTGTEYAREISDLAFNVYIGDDPDPAITYFVAPELGGDGKFHNFMPGEVHTYTSRRIPLTLAQMKAIDVDPSCDLLRELGLVDLYPMELCPGGTLRIVLEDYTYGIDELFYEDAVNSGVLVAIEDGMDDSDEAIDTYLIPTWGQETVLDVLARYFPHTTDGDGNLLAIWTPEYRADTPAWCNEPNRVGNTLWCKHALSTADWWNVYTDGLGDGSEGFQDTPAAPGSVALFRFNKDSDLDGYSDRSELRLGTDPSDPADHPQPELIAGIHTIPNGDQRVATLSLLNTGLYDAYGVEAVMIAPDDSVSITNNTVGGSGRVRALKQVIVGSRILLESPLPAAWTQDDHAVPAAGGYYTGQEDRTYTFTVQCGEPVCNVGGETWTLDWGDGVGESGSLNFGNGYGSPTFLDVGSFGVQLALYTGEVKDTESFTVEARTPRDTFQYTINREPHTEPVVIVSYNDPQGNHRFVAPVNLSHPTENLASHAGKMIHDGAGVEIVTQEPFTPTQTISTTVIAQAPVPATLVDAHLFLEFIDPEGTVVREEATTVTLEPGPNVVVMTWNSNDFNPAYDDEQDYIVMAFFTDWQGNILDTAARPLSSFQKDPKAVFALDPEGTTWDFGTVPQGTLLEHTFTLANTGMMNLKATVVGTGVRTDQNVPGNPPWTDTGLDVAAGDAIGIRASGTVCYSGGGTGLCNGPDGSGEAAPADWALPGASKFSLIAKIDDGTPFFVGSAYVDTAGSSGRLYLGTNDQEGGYGDNGGTYQAHIEIQGLPTSFQEHPSFSVSPADAMNLDVTLDTYYLPVGPFNRTILVRTSDPAYPTQVFQVQGTVDPFVAPARAMAASPYRPWDQRVAVSGDREYREVVTFDDTIAVEPEDVQPLRVYDDTREAQLGAGKEIARAAASGGLTASSADETALTSGEQVHSSPVAVKEVDLEPSGDASLLSSPPWWNASYLYRRQLNVTAGSAINTAYFAKSTFNLGVLPVRPDRNDVRVVYWNGASHIELDGIIVSDTEWYFPIGTNIGAGATDSNYWLYYDNPTAGSAPGDWGKVLVPRRDSNTKALFYFLNQNITDRSGQGRTYATHPSWGWVSGGKYGWSRRVNGHRTTGENGESIVNVDLGRTFTVEGWWYFETLTGYPPTWGNTGQVGTDWYSNAWAHVRQNGTVLLGVADDNYQMEEHADMGISLQPNTWYHLAWTFDNNTRIGKTYVNGSLNWQYQFDRNHRYDPTTWIGIMTYSTGAPEVIGTRISGIQVSSNVARTDFGYASIRTDPTVAVGDEVPHTGTISGKVFQDSNNNGTQDAGELGIGGVTVNLNGTGQSRTTNSSGDYSFTDVNPGSYTVSIVVPSGYTNTTPTSRSVSLDPGGMATANFGLLPLASISGKVFHDTNNSGVQDAGESGLEDMTVTLDGTGQTRTTASDGSYSFADLMPGSYSVSVTVPDGYVNTTPTTVPCNLGAGDVCSANFGILQYTIEKVAGSEHQNRVFLPESFRGGRRYWVQYGRRMLLTSAGEREAQVRLPQAHYSAATLDVLMTEAGNSFVQINIDVGDDGTWDWGYNGNLAMPATLEAGDFAEDLNDFMQTAIPDGEGFVTVPLRLSLNTSGRLYLTNFVATPDGISDAAVSETDVGLSPTDPVEGDTVDIQITMHNDTPFDTGGFVSSAYATSPDWGETYVGSAYVSNISAGGSAQVTIAWHTLGFTGDTPVRVVLDPGDSLDETDEENNEATANLVIKTRPDLQVTQMVLSDDEPVVGQTVTVALTLHNGGQTAADASALALYDGNPESDGLLLGEGTPAVPAEAEVVREFSWTPVAPGPHRLFAVGDRDGVVWEYDEGNNQTWQDVYVGFAGPILLDSGGGNGADPAYSETTGYGYLNGNANTFCGTEPEQSQRSDGSGQVQYRFDHLLPGHFYHLDVTLYECDGLGRQEQVLVDSNLVGELVDLSDGAVHRLSFLLDPAFYADNSITVTVEELIGYDAVVAEINLHDIDYRYADAGGSNDPACTAELGYGWLDGEAQDIWGALPYQTRRIDLGDGDPSDDPDNELRYCFDNLDPGLRYQIHLTFYQGAGGLVQQSIAIDDINTGTAVELDGEQRVDVTVDVPPGTYTGDGNIVLRITRTNATAGAFVNEVALEQLTLATDQADQVTQAIPLHDGGPNWFSFNVKPPVEPEPACSGVSSTSAFTSLAGEAILAGEPAPQGTIVEAYSPGRVKVGCFQVHTVGLYGYMKVYGAEGSTPGMEAGEPVFFKINGITAQPDPDPVIWQDDKQTHTVNLNAPDAIPVEYLLASIDGQYDKLLCEDGTYLPPPADPRFNTCTTVEPGLAYLLYANTPTELSITGPLVPTDTPMDLRADWNWIGYLPTCELAVEIALSSISGSHDLLHNEEGTYRPPPANPAFNNFNTMSSGLGYMIHVTEGVTLTYPADQCGQPLAASPGLDTAWEATDCPAIRTAIFTHYYGTARLGDVPYPEGTPILAYNPRGEVVGCGQVIAGGLYPYLRVYGADGDLPGMHPDELVRFTVNEVSAMTSAEPIWQGDLLVHPLDLNTPAVHYYLPLIRR